MKIQVKITRTSSDGFDVVVMNNDDTKLEKTTTMVVGDSITVEQPIEITGAINYEGL